MNSTIHLTQQQFCDLLIAAPSETSPELERLREHVLRCPKCAEEVAPLRQPLENFRSSVTAWAGHNAADRLWKTPATRSHMFGSFSGWMLAAAVLILLAILPVLAHHHDSPSTANNAKISAPDSSNASSTSAGDEALLEAVDQTVSSSIPAPMQPLADPTGSASQIDSTPRKN